MKVIDRKDAINHHIYNNQSFVETAIYRVSSLNQTVLASLLMKVAERYPVLPCPSCSDRLPRHPIWVEYNIKDLFMKALISRVSRGYPNNRLHYL